MKIIRNKLNTVIITIVVLTVISTLYTSCSLQKRVHNKGFHIEKIFTSNDNQNIDKQDSRETNKPIVLRARTNKFQPFSLKNSISTENETPVSAYSPSPLNNTSQSLGQFAYTESAADSCDVIIMKNGDQINAIVLEITESEVKFRECDKPNGPIFVKQKSSIVRINYPNGTSTVISSDRYISFGQSGGSNNPAEHNPNDRSLLITVLLWLFVGSLGIHRFYLGHIGIGILYLLTGALCGIGWLIDGILLLTGELKPKNGKYTE